MPPFRSAITGEPPPGFFKGQIMTDTTAQEPTMEEILASIRRIISEDDAPAAEAAPAPAPAPTPVHPEPEASPALMDETPSMQEPEPGKAAPAEEEEIFELTDRYQAPAAETIGDLDVGPAEPEPEPFPTAFHPEPEPVSHDPAPSASSVPFDSLVGDTAAASAASAFAGLSASLKQPDPVPTGGTGPTIDDLARSLLRPMLKEWLDANLPAIVEAQVRKEVERIARSAG
jgi:cell pole-organizing protein PopZ